MCLHITGHLNFRTYHNLKPVLILLNTFLYRRLEYILLCRAHPDADDIAYIKGLGYHHSTTRFYRIITLQEDKKYKRYTRTFFPFCFPNCLCKKAARWYHRTIFKEQTTGSQGIKDNILRVNFQKAASSLMDLGLLLV